MDTDDAELAEGRALTRTNLWRIFWISSVVAFMSASAVGVAAWLRVALIALVCLLVYRGKRGALWLLGLLTVFAGVMMVVVALGVPDLDWANRIFLAVLGVVQVLAFLILFKAPEVRRFMEYQRTRGAGPGDGAR